MKVNQGVAGLWHDSGPGGGKIWCVHAPVHGIEQRLLDLTIQMVEECNYSIVLSSVDTGSHVARSRHRTGRAEDISDVNLYGYPRERVDMTNPYARHCVEWLTEHNVKAGHENGAYDSVLYGPVNSRWNRTQISHEDHLHLSIWSTR